MMRFIAMVIASLIGNALLLGAALLFGPYFYESTDISPEKSVIVRAAGPGTTARYIVRGIRGEEDYTLTSFPSFSSMHVTYRISCACVTFYSRNDEDGNWSISYDPEKPDEVFYAVGNAFILDDGSTGGILGWHRPTSDMSDRLAEARLLIKRARTRYVLTAAK